MILSVWQQRHLLLSLIRRDVVGRYRGSSLGILWSFFHPILILAVYTFVFSVVFKARWTASSESRTEFALVLFSGMIVFNFFSECVTRTPGVILSNVNFVKKVVFPLEILPCVILGSALFHLVISLFVWLIFHLLFVGPPQPTAIFFPLVITPFVLFTLGVSWLLASLGVYIRDVSHVVGIATTVLLFLSPVFYPISALPEKYRFFLSLNPLTPTIEQTRNVLYWGLQPDWPALAIGLAVGIICAWGGFLWFQLTRRGFADVL